jgi:hypothetical protein
MNFNRITLIIFCFLIIFGCAERKVYMPEGKPSGEVTQKEEKKEVEKQKPVEEETLSSAQISELIRKLQEEIKDIHFNFDKYDIRQDDIPTLKKVASALQKYPKLKDNY